MLNRAATDIAKALIIPRVPSTMSAGLSPDIPGRSRESKSGYVATIGRNTGIMHVQFIRDRMAAECSMARGEPAALLVTGSDGIYLGLGGACFCN